MKNKIRLVLFLGMTLCSSSMVYNSQKNISENTVVKEEKTQQAVEKKEEIVIPEKVEKVIDTVENPMMKLVIPKLNISNNIYEKNSNENNIDKNVVIMNESTLPSDAFGNIILGGHSGTGKHAYFKDFDKLELNDLIYLHYNNKEYKYKIINIHKDIKDGKITVTTVQNRSLITLFTCNPNDKKTYLIVVGELIEDWLRLIFFLLYKIYGKIYYVKWNNLQKYYD